MKKQRIHIYMRVSTKAQTTENQMQECLDYISNNFDKCSTVVSYHDVGLSRDTNYKKKPGLVKMIASLQIGDIVLVSALDRFGLYGSDVHKLLDLLKEKQAEYIVTNGHYSYGSFMDKFELEVSIARDILDSLLEKKRMKMRVKERSNPNSNYTRKARGPNAHYFFDTYKDDIFTLLRLSTPVIRIHGILKTKHEATESSRFASLSTLDNYIKRFNLKGD